MDTNLYYNKTSAHPNLSPIRSELDFVKHWVDKTVQREILRGQELQKLKEYRPVVEEYDVINVDLNRRPFCETSTPRSQSTKATKKTKNKKPKKAVRKSTKKSSASNKIDVTDECVCPTFKRKRKRQKRCPMRITELAVPTKRQCLETWNANYRILPDIMVDRLRQYIRDQRPIVQISDAIYCFRRVKKTRKVKDAKKDIKKNIKCIAQRTVNSIKLTDARNFCGVFGYKISQALNKPLVVHLNTELQRIANVVTMDIADLLSKHKKPESIKAQARNQSMFDEISGKIAIWIWGILEESYHNILEDQLRDLDEELGPALDILDEIIDNSVDLCEPKPLIIDIPYVPSHTSYVEEEDIGEEDIGEENIGEEDENEFELSPVEAVPNINAAIINYLNNIIDNFDDYDVEDDDVKHEGDSERLSDVRSLEDKENVFEDANEDLQVADLITFETNENRDEMTNDQVEDEERNQVSHFSEDFHDGKDKKVTFEVDTVTDHFMFEESWKRPRKGYKEHSPVAWPSLSEIVFAKPNDHLLSQIDETWPYDILKDETRLRPSASICKSITSLGEIIESDDMISEMAEANEVKIEPSHTEFHETELDSIRYKHSVMVGNTDDYTLLPEHNDDKVVNNKATDTINLKDSEDQDLYSKEVQTSIELTKINQYKSEGTSTSPIRSRTDLNEHSKTVTSYSLDDFNKKKVEQITSWKKLRPNYKVHPCTAPSWAMRGFTETRKLPCLRKQPINQCKMRQWCNCLLVGYNNLELWNNWIIYASKLVKDMENKKATTCKKKFATEYMKLRKEINEDASTWINKQRYIRKQLGDIYQKTPICKIQSTTKPCLCSKKH